jgi:hypothetical protein
MLMMQRSAPEVLKDVMHEAKVAAAAIRRAGGGNCSDNNTPGGNMEAVDQPPEDQGVSGLRG